MTLSTDILAADLHYVIWENVRHGRTDLHLSRAVRSNCTHYDPNNPGVLKEGKRCTALSRKSNSGIRNIWTSLQMLQTFRLVIFSTCSTCVSVVMVTFKCLN